MYKRQVLYLLGLAQIAVYFVVFTVLIKALDLPTPGRRPEEPSRPEKALPLDEQDVYKRQYHGRCVPDRG